MRTQLILGVQSQFSAEPLIPDARGLSRRDAIFPVARTRARASHLSLSLSLSLALSVHGFRERGTLEGEKRRARRGASDASLPGSGNNATSWRALRPLPLIVAVDRLSRGHPCLGRTREHSGDAIGRRVRAREGYVRTGSARFARSRRKRRQLLGRSRSTRSTETLVAPREC